MTDAAVATVNAAEKVTAVCPGGGGAAIDIKVVGKNEKGTVFARPTFRRLRPAIARLPTFDPDLLRQLPL